MITKSLLQSENDIAFGIYEMVKGLDFKSRTRVFFILENLISDQRDNELEIQKAVASNGIQLVPSDV